LARVAAVLLAATASLLAAGQPEVEELASKARVAFESGNSEEALDLLAAALELRPRDSALLSFQGQIRELQGELELALESFDRLVMLEPDNPRALMLRAQVLFKLGRIDLSLLIFDRIVELDPRSEPYLWQRGIAQYYAGRYSACRQQFEHHRTVNPNDVENSAWHFLCVARESGVAAARAAILPVGEDSRRPLMEIDALFRANGSVEDVLRSAAEASGDEASRDSRFYAHLYVGLYLEAIGQREAGLEHITMAHKLGFPHYMGDVARVHLQRSTADPTARRGP